MKFFKYFCIVLDYINEKINKQNVLNICYHSIYCGIKVLEVVTFQLDIEFDVMCYLNGLTGTATRSMWINSSLSITNKIKENDGNQSDILMINILTDICRKIHRRVSISSAG